MTDKNNTNTKDVRVLLIGDNRLYTQIITNFIDQSGRLNAEIKTVDSIEKAKAIISHEETDIILLDIDIKEMKLEELFNVLAKDNLSIPYIVITDESDEDLGIEAVKKGAQDYFVRSELSERTLRRGIIYSLERHDTLQSLYRSAIVDELTGLYNRRGLHTLGNQQVELARRHKEDIFIFYLDLDGMKSINDTLGHEFGDRALIDTSNIMHKTFRTTDILSRLGGDEFVVVAVKAQHESIPNIIQRLGDYVEEANSPDKKYNLSISVGVSKINLKNESPLDEAIQDADKEMYKEKINNKKINL
jgi:diguanylate cyclase (GGDEF)-like protein